MNFVDQITSFCARFRREDEGAVTVDLVVITAAIVSLSLAVLTSISTGANDLASDTGETIAKLEMWGETETPGPRPE